MPDLRHRLPEGLLAPLRWLRRAIAFALFRPEADRLLLMLSEPILETGAYVDRTLRDIELRLPSHAGDDLVAMYAFRALAGVPRGAKILVAGPASPLLGRALSGAGYAITGVEEAGYQQLASAAFDAVLLLDGRDPAGVRRLARPGAILITTRGARGLRGWKDVERVSLPGAELLTARAG